MPEGKQAGRASLLVAIVDRGRGERAALLCGGAQAPHLICAARGTANSEILDLLGLARTAKEVMIGLLPPFAAHTALQLLAAGLGLARPGRGVAFVLPLSGVSSRALQLLESGQFITDEKEEERQMETRAEKDLVLAVVNAGYIDQAVEAARGAGARGGTLLHGRSTGDAADFLGVPLLPERELAAILVPAGRRRQVLEALNQAVGLSTPAGGLIFSLPVLEAVGLPPEGE